MNGVEGTQVPRITALGVEATEEMNVKAERSILSLKNGTAVRSKSVLSSMCMR